uniref:Uncharacterized protein LOC105034429 isoform X1 n=1 Tax=Elaeis guineensis var. tenera TaxID=51953 RepID=A0A8N4ERG9_ELAGV|nr:uncharacterized protein LOC105034429 isoform X1 [Elaeis guineensis]
MEIDGKVPPDLLQEREICALRRKEAKRKMKEKQQRRLLLIKGSDEKLNRLSSPKISISTEQVAMEPQTNPISTPLMPTPYLNQVQWVPSANNYFMIPGWIPPPPAQATFLATHWLNQPMRNAASLLPSAVEPPITYGVVSNIEGIQSWRDSSRENPFTNTIQGVLQESDNIYIGATSNQIAIKEGTSQDKQCGNKMPYVV